MKLSTFILFVKHHKKFADNSNEILTESDELSNGIKPNVVSVVG